MAWVEKFVLGFGILTAVGLAASATATAATNSLYDVAPVSPRARSGAVEDDDAVAPPADASRGREGNAELERRARARRQAVDTILGRNNFCPTCVPATPSAAGAPGDSVFPAPTAGPVLAQLVATMEAEPIEASLATVYSAEVGTRIVRIGDVLEGDAVVTAIGSGRLRYARGQGEGVLDINEPAAPPKATTPRSPKKPSAKPPTTASDQIACKRPGECTVERALVEDTLANPSALGGLRAFPSGDGFKISGVRRGTLAHQLGLRSGDVLTEVNGRTLDTVDAALKLLPALRNANNFSVSLQRKGKPLTHNVQII